MLNPNPRWTGFRPITAMGSWAVLTLGLGLNLAPAIAQTTADSTLSTTITTTDPLNVVIQGGSRAGGNLFHSFEQFSVPTGGSVHFDNAIAVENIIGRVTGHDRSEIDGLIQANGTANLFLLNPNGFLFGPNAQLDIGGSFLATTADRLLFDDDISFNTTQSAPLLSIHTPLGLQMGANPGAIHIQGPGHQLAQINNFTETMNLATVPLGLAGNSSQTLALIGGPLTLDGAVLSATGGHIELASIQQGTVDLNTSEEIWTFKYEDTTAFENIWLSHNALVDVSANRAGSMALTGGDIILQTGATLLSQNSGNRKAGDITVHTDEALSIRGVNVNGFRSGIRSDSFGQGTGSPVRIEAPLLRLRNGGAIRTTTFGPGRSGDIHIQAQDAVRIIGMSPSAPTLSIDVSTIAATSIDATGHSGNITINTDNLRVRDGGLITSSTILGKGDGGDIWIDADSIRLARNTLKFAGSGISAATLGDGNAGQVDLHTRELIIAGGNIVDSSSTGNGDAGDLMINATERIIVRNYGPGVSADAPRPSVISSAAIQLDEESRQILDLDPIPTGHAGNLSIRTPSLRLANGGMITITAEGSGDAGQLEVWADTIALIHEGEIAANTTTGSGGNVNLHTHRLRLENGLISASSFSAGTGGNITIQADELVEVIGAGTEALRNDIIFPVFAGNFDPNNFTQGIGAFALNTGEAGQIHIQTNQLRLQEGGIIASSTFGDTVGGNIDLQATNMDITSSVVTTSTFGRGQAGDIEVNTQNLSFRGGSQFLSSTFGEGRAGDLSVVALGEVLVDGRSFSDGLFVSSLSAGSQDGSSGNGGDITVTAPLLRIQNGADISASAVTNPFIRLSIGLPEDTDQGRSRPRPLPSLASSPRSPTEMGAQAGNILLQVGTLILDNGRIIALSDAGEGGNITLTLDNGLILANNSRISTQAGNATSSGGNGGNMTIQSPFIAAVGNSDIIADARDGDGGNIQIATQGLFNLAVRETLTSDNDITSSSESGVRGTIQVTTFDIDPGKEAIVLPTTIADPTQHVATACLSSAESRFVITGQGGLPLAPDGDGDRPWSHILPDFGPIPNALPNTLSHSFTDPAPIDPSTPSEATTLAIAPNGEVQLVATTSQKLPGPSPSCVRQPHIP